MPTQTRTPVRIDASSGGAPPSAAAAGAALLRQCAAFVRQLDDAAYAADSATIRGGTIGKHVRHVLDHFRAAIEQGTAGRVIDYDHRERNVPMETDRAAALAAIDTLGERLGTLRESDLVLPVRVRVMLTADGAEVELGSTLGRELAFAAHHAVHHHAMLKAMASEFGVHAPPEFGKAPSTLRHEAGPR